MEGGTKRPSGHSGQGPKKKNKSPPTPQVDPVCSGVVSEDDKRSVDIKISSFSVSVGGNEVATSPELTLRYGRAYGLIGSSSCSKSAILQALASNKTPIPAHMETCVPIFEANHRHLSVREYVTSCDEEKEKMQEKYEILSVEAGECEALNWLSTRQESLEEDVDNRAWHILYGLGFDRQMLEVKAEDLAAGWRIRLALAKSLFLKPAVLLLDEPTMSLDLGTSIWLAESLKALQQRCILIVVSNDADFLNKVCSDMIHIRGSVLEQFEGTYDTYIQANQFPGPGLDKIATFQLPNSNSQRLVSPILQLAKAAYGYSPEKPVFKNLDFDIDQNNKIALVGAKSSGKSTLLKLLASQLAVQGKGTFACSPGLRIGYFDQRSIENLGLNGTVKEFMKKDCPTKREGDFGLSRTLLNTQMKCLSHCQKVTVVFACLAAKHPHVLLIDDPTVHLDIESINSLGNALRRWNGTLVLVSTNVRLIDQVASDVWICGSQGIIKHRGDIMDLKKEMEHHDAYMRKLQVPTEIRGTYPLFGFVNSTEVALSSLLYDQYIDESDSTFLPGCVKFNEFIKKRAMVAAAPSQGLVNGDMEIEGELNPSQTYRMLTEPGKIISRSLLENIDQLEKLGESLGDFDSSNLWVTPSGRVVFKGVKRHKLCPVGLRKSHMTAHGIIKDMCSEGGDIPEDVQHLLNMIEKEPEKSPLYPIHASVVPLCRYTGFFMALYEHVLRTIPAAVRDQILLKVPYVDKQEWHGLVRTNRILMETYTYGSGMNYILLPLPKHATAQEIRERNLLKAKLFLDYLRNRTCHRMDYLQQIKKYMAEGSDLATLARFSLVCCYLQEALFQANHMSALNLHRFF